DDGGVTVTEKRHLTGSAAQRATAAIDGDGNTHWTTGFQSSVGDWAQYQTAEPVSFDRLDLRVVADARHSLPTRLKVAAGGETVEVELPRITRKARPGTVV